MGCTGCSSRKKPIISINQNPKDNTHEMADFAPPDQNLYTIKEESAKYEESFIPSRVQSNIPNQSQKSYDFSSSQF